MNERFPANGHSHGLNGHGPQFEPVSRQPPHNPEAEDCVLASVIVDNAILPELREFLDAADFWRDRSQILFRAFCTLEDQEKPINGPTLSDLLTQRDQLKAVGGDTGLHELVARHVVGVGPLHAGLIGPPAWVLHSRDFSA
jgi:replicative DNA helicase